MFFGNQVTCEYWDFVWLNEGFASYLEYVITDKVSRKVTSRDTTYLTAAIMTDSSRLAYFGLF